MNTITTNYDLIKQYRPAPEYKLTSCGQLFNTKTGRKIKKTVNCRSVGYWIKGNFVTLTNLQKGLTPITLEDWKTLLNKIEK